MPIHPMRLQYSELANAILPMVVVLMRELEASWQDERYEDAAELLDGVQLLSEQFFTISRDVGEAFQVVFRECLDGSSHQDMRYWFENHPLISEVDDPFAPFAEKLELRFSANKTNEFVAADALLSRVYLCLLLHALKMMGNTRKAEPYSATSQR